MKLRLDRVCYFCQKTFSWVTNLEKHLRTHTKERPYSCNVCLKEFSTTGELKRHKIIHLTKQEREKYKSKFKQDCSFCHKQFITASQLKIHIWSHTKEKLFTCGICRRGFNNPANLCKH